MSAFVHIMVGLGLAATAGTGIAQQPLPPPARYQLPKVIKPLPLPPATKPAPTKPAPAPSSSSKKLELPYRTTTPAIEVVGSKATPEPLAEFSPVRLTTPPIAVVGGTAVPEPLPEFRPVRLTTPPIEVVGAKE